MAVASLFEDLLDQYKVEQLLAEKRCTDLYRAYDVDDDHLVRLDILRNGYAEDSSFASRFVNRARALAQVHHPNIARILHIGKDAAGAPYVAQAAVDGYSLSYRLEQLAQRNTTANPIYALKLIRQLADALLLAERLEIFHYDLQPDNVMLKNVMLPADDTVVLIDLFIPPKLNSQTAATMERETRRRYLSPEQLNGKDITAASHVYSLSAMLYHLLAGNMPEQTSLISNTAIGRLLHRTTPLARARADLSPATYQLVDRGLRKDPRVRFPTIESFSAALDNALAAEEARLGAASIPATTERKAHLWLAPALILALLLAVGAVVWQGVAINGLSEQNRGLNVFATSLSNYVGGRENDDATPTTAPTAGAVASIEAADTAVMIVDQQPTEMATVGATVVVTVVDTVMAAAAGEETIATTEQSELPQAVSSPTSTPTAEPTSTPPLTPTPVTPRVRVMHNLVNLRDGPGVVYSLAGVVTGGELLEVLAWNNDLEKPWYLVITPDQRIAWIAATVVQAENLDAMDSVPVAATLPATPSPSITLTPTPTVITVSTPLPTTDPGDLGGGVGTASPDPPPPEPTAAPATPPIEPSFTPPALPTDSP